MSILVTGSAGFIGFHTVKKLLMRGEEVIGIDNLNDYYDPKLKESRLKVLENESRLLGGKFIFYKENIANKSAVDKIFSLHKPKKVVNLAAQAGVRYSLENPLAYVESNILAFTIILEACRHNEIEHLVYASTSSVYGANTNTPFSEHSSADHPLQFYAATKRANELMAHSYSHLFKLPTTGLRFFTVYGPWGRPDMALFLFAKNIIEGKPITVFNYGNHSRDFTFVEDIVEGIIRVMDKPAAPNPNWDSKDPDPCSSNVPFKIYNIGNNSPVKLTQYIDALEFALGKKAIKEYLPLQAGDILDTFADVSELMSAVDFKPVVTVKEGIEKFVVWYKDYYNIP